MALKYLAEHPETPALSAKDVADAYGIPAQLLAKILQRLTKVGLLRSHAGMNGGYALSRDARQISAFEVIHAIDGPLFHYVLLQRRKVLRLDPQLHHQGTSGARERDHCRSFEKHQHSGSGRAGTSCRESPRGAAAGLPHSVMAQIGTGLSATSGKQGARRTIKSRIGSASNRIKQKVSQRY